jgi:hypothetical protein
MNINKKNHLNNISKFLIWSIAVLLPIFFGIFVYTPEYNGSEKSTDPKYLYKGIKTTLNFIMDIRISRISIILIFLIILLIISIIVQNLLKEFHKLNSELENSNQEKLNLKSDLNKLFDNNIQKDKKEKIVENMKILRINYPDIISIQIYKCTQSRKKSMIEFEIKPTKYFYTKENEVANLIHERYRISESSINEYLKCKKLYSIGKYEEFESYMGKLKKRLNDKFIKHPYNVTEAVINDYTLLTLALQLDVGDYLFTIDSLDKDFQVRINKAKRNGFLRGIIENTFYKFTHIGDSNKGNRVYITRCLNIERIPHMFVIVLQPEFLKNENYDDIANEIGEAFYSMLENDLDLV